MCPFEVDIVDDGGRHRLNGKARCRVVLMVDMRERLVEQVTLDSASAIKSTAKRWAADHDLDAKAIEARLRDLGLTVVAEAAEQRTDAKPKPTKRVSDLASEFLKSRGPVHHRKRQAIFLESLGAEVSVSRLWTLATDAEIDAITYTVEGGELFHDGQPPAYRTRLALVRDALALAAARIMETLPEVKTAAVDPTSDREELIAAVAAWLTKGRMFRTDTGTPVTINFFEWATDIEPGHAWMQCFTTPVFGRINEETGRPEVAVQGAHLFEQLRYEGHRRLAGDLRFHGLAVTDYTLRATGKVWRAWLLSHAITDSIATPITEGAVT